MNYLCGMITIQEILEADTYNVAFRYLKAKRYTRLGRWTETFGARLLACKTQRERNLLESNATDDDRECALPTNLTIQDFRTSNDYEIYLLVKQYYLGIEAKKDLYNKLIYMGLLVVSES